MYDSIEIQSQSGIYKVEFDLSGVGQLFRHFPGDVHFIVDQELANLYGSELDQILTCEKTIKVIAEEGSKEISRVSPLIETLLKNGIRRQSTIVAIGGGVIQDIACFISTVLYRGVDWNFVPTTLLSQADSCIGSKSSINLGAFKNILGTFKPPKKIVISPEFLTSLERKEIQSGIGEIIKVHIIDGPESFDLLATEFDLFTNDMSVLSRYIERALKIKKKYIELDEFDKGIRNIFNYGHSFGHAIESATDFAVPHGIAVTIGMDMANNIAAWRGLLPSEHRDRMQPVLKANYSAYANVDVPLDGFIEALQRDKKNTVDKLVLIMPLGEKAEVQKVKMDNDLEFRNQCEKFLREMQA